MENGNGGWYNTSREHEWYGDISTRPAPEIPEKKKRRLRPGMKAVMLSLCVVILIAATALAFAVPVEVQEPQSSEPELGDGFPFNGDDAFPEDFREFFESYYTSDQTTQPSTIAPAGAAPERRLELCSNQELSPLKLQELYEKCSPSIVSITAWKDSRDNGYYWGSGIVMSEDGYILTNAHVISGTTDASVKTASGEEYEALLVGEDTQSDLAILKIEAEGLIPAEFGKSDELRVGDEVAAIGNPLSPELAGTLTNGIVSAINRDVMFNGHKTAFIQTNAAINEGNSGGALFNMYGQVVGITNMKFSAAMYQTSIEGIGFAIPTSTVKEIADQLFENGSVNGRPGIGITAGSVPASAAEEYNLPETGVYITEVYKTSDAWAKGLRPGDVITMVNDTPVASVDEINLIKDGLEIGDELKMTVFRDGKTFEVYVELMDFSSFN